jgi:hypothetical protein
VKTRTRTLTVDAVEQETSGAKRKAMTAMILL